MCYLKRDSVGITWFGGLVALYGVIDLVNIGSVNGLFPDRTKPLPESMLTNHHWGTVASIWGQFHSKYPRYLPVIEFGNGYDYGHISREQWVKINYISSSMTVYTNNHAKLYMLEEISIIVLGGKTTCWGSYVEVICIFVNIQWTFRLCISLR